MTAAPSAPATADGEGRPRRWWVAFLLNLLLPPSGYAYAGSWLAAAMAFLLIVLVPMMGMQVTAAYPPGVYALGLSGIVALSAIAAVALAGHAAVLAAKAPPKTGNPVAHAMLYGLAWAVAFGANVSLRAFWPNPTYEVAAASMAPTLQPGDIVLVDGARARCGGRKLRAGQVVLYRQPAKPQPFMLRIVAGPGQTVSMDAGRLKVDGRPLVRSTPSRAALPDTVAPAVVFHETLPNGVSYRIADSLAGEDLDTAPPIVVPQGAWYLLGDNRDDVVDSRVHGPVRTDDICAVAQKIVAARDMSRVGQAL